jgi:hypothetical protein
MKTAVILLAGGQKANPFEDTELFPVTAREPQRPTKRIIPVAWIRGSCSYLLTPLIATRRGEITKETAFRPTVAMDYQMS